MKDFKNDSTATLARFGRDKRERTFASERVERRPRLQRDAADAEHSSDRRPRASYNPNFTHDNRPVREDRSERGDRFGREERPRRSFGQGDGRGFGGRGHAERGEHRFGSDERRRDYSGKRTFAPRSEEGAGTETRGEYRSADRKSGGYKKFGKPTGDKRFGDRKPGRFERSDKPFGERRSDDRRSGGYKGSRTFDRREDRPKSYPKYNPNKQTGEMRLNRFVAQSGICSRREADDFILAGLVTVNGTVVTELGTKVLPTDEVKFNDSRVEGEKKVYLVLNKPKGFVTSLDDPHAEKTVMELVDGACAERIYPVGRLDKNSVGLLLFTNDGDLTRQLTHPSFQKKKIYQVSLDKPLTRADMDRIAEGITLEDGEIYADEIAYVKDDKQEVGIEIHSGRNRIVRRIFEHLGYAVKKLDRVYYAGLSKKNLKRGQWRFLTREEVQRLKSGQYE